MNFEKCVLLSILFCGSGGREFVQDLVSAVSVMERFVMSCYFMSLSVILFSLTSWGNEQNVILSRPELPVAHVQHDENKAFIDIKKFEEEKKAALKAQKNNYTGTGLPTGTAEGVQQNIEKSRNEINRSRDHKNAQITLF